MTQLSAFNLPLIDLLLCAQRFFTVTLPRRKFFQREVEASEATLRDPGLDRKFDGDTDRRLPPFHMADIHSSLESTRMRLFLLTGHYWRGS